MRGVTPFRTMAIHIWLNDKTNMKYMDKYYVCSYIIMKKIHRYFAIFLQGPRDRLKHFTSHSNYVTTLKRSVKITKLCWHDNSSLFKNRSNQISLL